MTTHKWNCCIFKFESNLGKFTQINKVRRDLLFDMIHTTGTVLVKNPYFTFWYVKTDGDYSSEISYILRFLSLFSIFLNLYIILEYNILFLTEFIRSANEESNDVMYFFYIPVSCNLLVITCGKIYGIKL